MPAYQRRPGQSPVVLIIIIVVVGVLGIVLVAALGGQPGQIGNQDTPQPVHDRVVQDLQRNDMQALYEEMSPSLKEIFALDELMAEERSVVATQGQINHVEVLEPPAIRTGPEWNGEWADATVRIIRGTMAETYVVRFHLENGQWWLFGTLKTQ